MYGGLRNRSHQAAARRRFGWLHGGPRPRRGPRRVVRVGDPGRDGGALPDRPLDGGPRLAAGLHLAKRAIVGRPLATGSASAGLLPKRLALPIFASDALSSVAYATEAALAVLLAASLSGRRLLIPISLAVAALLVLVVLSYRQTVRAYPGGGGSYVVASKNLGRVPGLVAGASLLVDYVLTVAVSIAAGVLAITSAAPALSGWRVELSLAFLVGLAVANARGVREAGKLFAIPTYGFVAATIAMVAVGLGKCAVGGCPQARVPDPASVGTAASVSAVVVLRAFASGCSALTGVEAIANGVRAFEPPQARNAARTLAILGVIAVGLFLGVSTLAFATGARPSAEVSVLSEVARAVFPTGSPEAAGFLAVQGFTFAILVLAANTAFQGFPRLTAILARDRFLPDAFANLGDRLVYSNGIVLLALVAGFLLVAFHASPDALLHLYLLGVFTAFTLSQAGMLRHWHRSRERGWRRSMVINGLGAAGTGLVALLVLGTKFREGAWMVLIAVPVLVGCFLLLHRHYRTVGRRLRTGSPDPTGALPVTVLLKLDRLDAAAELALAFAAGLRGPDVRAVHVLDGSDPGPVAARWSELGRGKLELVPGNVSRVDGMTRYVEELARTREGIVNVVIPELFERRSLVSALRRTPEFRLAARLHEQPGVVVTHVPALATETTLAPALASTTEALVLVSEVDDAVAGAVAYALAIGGADTRAIHVALDPRVGERVRSDWESRPMPGPLEMVEAPFRSLEQPVLEIVRAVTARPNTVAAVVVPELATGRWGRDLLHNERALYLAWLLRFEPGVVFSSVPLRRRL
jgi:amino acid transporter